MHHRLRDPTVSVVQLRRNLLGSRCASKRDGIVGEEPVAVVPVTKDVARFQAVERDTSVFSPAWGDSIKDVDIARMARALRTQRRIAIRFDQRWISDVRYAGTVDLSETASGDQRKPIRRRARPDELSRGIGQQPPVDG